jgi:hypothetical protein
LLIFEFTQMLTIVLKASAASALAATAVAFPQSVSAEPSEELISRFSAAANAFTTCLGATVKIGMTTRMDPETFKVGFAQSCIPEESRFKELPLEVSIANGQTEAQAKAEIEANIVKGRAIYASDQEQYVKTGRIPR